MDKEVS